MGFFSKMFGKNVQKGKAELAAELAKLDKTINALPESKTSRRALTKSSCASMSW